MNLVSLKVIQNKIFTIWSNLSNFTFVSFNVNYNILFNFFLFSCSFSFLYIKDNKSQSLYKLGIYCPLFFNLYFPLLSAVINLPFLLSRYILNLILYNISLINYKRFIISLNNITFYSINLFYSFRSYYIFYFSFRKYITLTN